MTLKWKDNRSWKQITLPDDIDPATVTSLWEALTRRYTAVQLWSGSTLLMHHKED